MTFALFFDSVGGGEWLVLLAVVLIVMGPKNLPAAARKMGKAMSHLRRAADEFKRQLMAMDEEVNKAVEDVKDEYMNVGQDVQDTVSDDGTSTASSDASTPYEGSTDEPQYDEESDRAMWESYGRDYDPDGAYGYSDEDAASGEVTAEAPSMPETPSSDVASSETPPMPADPPAEQPPQSEVAS